jgi:hypothetical protein
LIMVNPVDRRNHSMSEKCEVEGYYCCVTCAVYACSKMRWMDGWAQVQRANHDNQVRTIAGYG